MPSSPHILIAGGTGLIGTRLTELLLEKGYSVAHLSRSPRTDRKVRTYVWNIEDGYIQEGAVEQAGHIVQLAGANIGEKRWTDSRKKELAKSRIESTRLLYDALKNTPHQVKSFISASGINFYGSNTGNRIMREDDPAGEDFIGRLCKAWEAGALKMEELRIRVVALRSGLALSREGGFLKALLPVVKAGLSAPVGLGKQYLSWIHVDDLCRMYIQAIEDDSMRGVFNAAAPHPVINREFMKQLAKSLKRPFIVPPVPGFALKLILGEVADSILGGVRASTAKIESMGFRFLYPHLEEALFEIFTDRK